MSKHFFNDAAEENAAYNFKTEQFFDTSETEFNLALLENLSNARGGNGGGGGGKKDKPNDNGDTGDGGETPVTYEPYISGLESGSDYNIEIQFTGDGWNDLLVQAFIDSAELFSKIIVGDRPDFVYDAETNNFFDQYIDDILITANLTYIDGPGGILGHAGPEYITWFEGQDQSKALPITGMMEFDSADAATYLENGTWDDIVFHEMAHVLGFGTMWEYGGIVDVYVDDNDTRRPNDDIISYNYNGEFATMHADSPLTPDVEEISPVIETDGGSGTAGGHWDEATYDTEIMTGYIDYPSNYLSQMTLTSFADLGYEVNWNDAEIMDYILIV